MMDNLITKYAIQQPANRAHNADLSTQTSVPSQGNNLLMFTCPEDNDWVVKWIWKLETLGCLDPTNESWVYGLSGVCALPPALAEGFK
jgi:hypothetical protein